MSKNEETISLDDMKKETTEVATEEAINPEEVATEEATLGTSSMVAADPKDFAKKSKPEKVVTIESKIFNNLDVAMDRVKGEIDEDFEKKVDKLNEEEFESEEELEETGDSKPAIVEEKKLDDADVVRNFNINENDDFLADLDIDDFDTDDDDLDDDLDTDEVSEEEIQESIKLVRSKLKENYSPISNVIDINNFKINKKPISAAKVLSNIENRPNSGVWVMPNANRAFEIEGLTGLDLDNIEGYTRESGQRTTTPQNRLSALKKEYGIIYKNIIDDNKPSFEAWLKSTKFYDIDHIYFGLYLATFSNSNSMALTCTECKKTFMGSFPISDVIKYGSDEDKDYVVNLCNTSTLSPTEHGEYENKLVQISDDYVVAICNPSIYNVYFEPATINEKAAEKYRDTIMLFTYIEDIYVIDSNNNELVHVNYHKTGNMVQTTKNKYKFLYEIIKSLTTDQLFNVKNEIGLLIEEFSNNKISYTVPSVLCSYCGAPSTNDSVSAKELVLLRHQLAAAANS